MKIAYTGWTWCCLSATATREDYVRAFEQSTKEIAYLGYDCMENFAFMADYFPDPQELVKITEKYNMPLVNMYGHFNGVPDEDIARAKKQVDFIAAIGGKWFNCQHAGFSEGPKERPIDKPALDVICKIADEVAKYAAEKGVTLCFHPHYGTLVFDREQIDYFAEHTNPEYVKFCFDTAHTTLAGINPIDLVKAYGLRIDYIHLKDVDPAHEIDPANPSSKMAAFRALGLGTVDFKGFVKELKKIGYDGVLCVELDNPEICNFQSAQVSREYIKNVLKM